MFESPFFALFVLMFDLTEQTRINPDPAVDHGGFGSPLSWPGEQFDLHNQLASRPEGPLVPTSTGCPLIDQPSSNQDHRPSLSLIDSWIATSPMPEFNEDQTSPLSIEKPSRESIIDALRYSGFSFDDKQFMRALEVEAHTVEQPNQHLDNKQSTSSSSHCQGSISFPFVELNNLMDASSSKERSPVDSADVVKHLGVVNVGNLQHNPLPVKRLSVKKEDWMIQQIDSLLSEFARTLHSLHPKPNQIQFLYKRKHLKELSLIITKMEAKDLTTTAFCWIAHPDESYFEREQLINSFKYMITSVTYDHYKILKKLHIAAGAIQIHNQAILEWLRDEILNPPIGFPIMGDITSQKFSLVSEEKQPMFGKLNSLLSHFFGQANPQPKASTLSSILMNFWYFSRQTQMAKEINMHPDLCLALKAEIEKNAAVPQPSYFLAQYLD